MKKTNFLSNKAKSFIALLICWTALLLPHKISAQSGTSCSTAVNLDSVIIGKVNLSTGDGWVKFTARTSQTGILVKADLPAHPTQPYGNYIDTLQLYSGTCSSLTSISVLHRLTNHYAIISYSFIVGHIYYLRISSGCPSCEKNMYAVQSIIPYGPSTCDAVCNLTCNGNFENTISNPPILPYCSNIDNSGCFGSYYNNYDQVFEPLSIDPAVDSQGTVDYFNASAIVPVLGQWNMGVSINYAGTQAAYNGSAYAGIYTYTLDSTHLNNIFDVSMFAHNTREYLQQQLCDSMVKGRHYKITFSASLSGKSNVATRLGVLLKDDTLTQTLNSHGDYGAVYSAAQPQWETSGLVTDTTNWQTYQFTYTATANHKTIAFGNFRPDSSGYASVVSNKFFYDYDTYYHRWIKSGGSYYYLDGISVLPVDTLKISGNSTTCHGTPVTLTGSIDGLNSLGNPIDTAGHQVWTSSPNDPSIANAGDKNYIVATPAVTTMYTCTWTDRYGCVYTKTFTLTVFSQPTVHIVASSGLASCDPNPIVFTTQPSGFSTYVWTTNAPTYSGQSTSALTATWGTSFSGNGYVTVYVTDANGCHAKDSIVVPSCCKGETHTLTNSKTSANLSTFPLVSGYQQASNTSFDIDGNFTVDMNTRFKRDTVKLGPNAKIIIAAGCKLELDSSFFYACTDMWNGIFVDGTNSASEVRVIHYSVIEDAKNAIVSTNNGKFTIDGTNGKVKLNKNYVAVQIRPYTGAHSGTIKKAIISCDSPSQPGGSSFTSSGANCRNPINGISFTGILVDTCTNVVIGDTASLNNRNTFERTQYGIYSLLSVVKVQNNDFKYFTTTILPQHNNTPGNGVAVYATNRLSSTNRTLTVGQPGLKKATNYFLKCSYGVMASDWMGLSCQFNRFDSCSSVGIYALADANRTILINKDTLVECAGTNISCISVNNSTVTITGNMINQTQSFSSTNFGQTGIYVANAVNAAHVTLSIQNNQVKKMRNGIWVSYVVGGKIYTNTVTILTGQTLTNANPATGIRIEKDYGIHVRQNTLSYAVAPGSTLYDKLFGIYIYDSKIDTITKNTITNMGSGIYMKTANNPSVIACNSNTSCIIGINFGYTNSVNAPVSLNSQLLWQNTTNTPTGNSWSGCTTDLRGSISNGPISWYYNTTNTPATWSFVAFSFTNGNAPYPLGSTSDQCSQMLAPPHQTDIIKRDNMLAGICKTPRTYNTYSTQFLYDDKVFAYKTLMENPSWTSLGTSDDTCYSNFVTAQSTTNIGKLYTVESDIASNNFTDAANALSSITPSNTQETNYKTVMDIYLHSWALDSMNLTTGQADTLRTIASQGALTGGTAVFDARNMLNEEVHDSSNVRIANPAINGELQSSASYIYPNPTTGQISITVDLPQGQNGTLELFDLTGRRIIAWQLISGQSLYTFDASFLPSGTYIYRVAEGEEVLRTDRLIIIKQ